MDHPLTQAIRRVVPPPRLLPAPSEAAARLVLRRLRVENRFGIHLAVWAAACVLLSVLAGPALVCMTCLSC